VVIKLGEGDSFATIFRDVDLRSQSIVLVLEAGGSICGGVCETLRKQLISYW